MCDTSLLIERLENVLEALERIPRRFAGITSPGDFLDNPEGQDRLDAICMVLVAVGEAFKQVVREKAALGWFEALGFNARKTASFLNRRPRLPAE